MNFSILAIRNWRTVIVTLAAVFLLFIGAVMNFFGGEPSNSTDLASQGGNIPVGPVTEPDLRYQNIPPELLYTYVQAHDSSFTLQDIESMCQAAKTYDVNPALLVAITGQEQSFVPVGTPDATLILNNPWNVYYSWQDYNTNIADAANIAASTLRHKLSVAPPAGEDAIAWINDPRNPWGIYATDTNWSNGVRKFYDNIMQVVHMEGK